VGRRTPRTGALQPPQGDRRTPKVMPVCDQMPCIVHCKTLMTRLSAQARGKANNSRPSSRRPLVGRREVVMIDVLTACHECASASPPQKHSLPLDSDCGRPIECVTAALQSITCTESKQVWNPSKCMVLRASAVLKKPTLEATSCGARLAAAARPGRQRTPGP
jgi:hypothetical protein